MGEHPHLQSDPVLVADGLTGLETTPIDLVDSVRVEVLNTASDGGAVNIEALRQTIAATEQRLSGIRALRQQLEASEQRLARAIEERDQLSRELSQTRQQLTEVNALQQQLQALLEQT
jgi:DNA repair exonuclease SbcCD ATPase subunit